MNIVTSLSEPYSMRDTSFFNLQHLVWFINTRELLHFHSRVREAFTMDFAEQTHHFVLHPVSVLFKIIVSIFKACTRGTRYRPFWFKSCLSLRKVARCRRDAAMKIAGNGEGQAPMTTSNVQVEIELVLSLRCIFFQANELAFYTVPPWECLILKFGSANM